MERITFLIEDSGERISCMLNPERVVLRRTTGLVRKRSLGPELEGAAEDLVLRTGGGTTEIELDLLFDLTLGGGSGPPGEASDVRELTRAIWQLTERSASGSRAATARLIWGRSWNVRIVVDALAERLEEFSPAGAPRRSWLRARLLRVAEEPSRSLEEVEESTPAALDLEAALLDSALGVELPEPEGEAAPGEEGKDAETLQEQAAVESGLWDLGEELQQAAETAASDSEPLEEVPPAEAGADESGETGDEAGADESGEPDATGGEPGEATPGEAEAGSTEGSESEEAAGAAESERALASSDGETPADAEPSEEASAASGDEGSPDAGESVEVSAEISVADVAGDEDAVDDADLEVDDEADEADEIESVDADEVEGTEASVSDTQDEAGVESADTDASEEIDESAAETNETGSTPPPSAPPDEPLDPVAAAPAVDVVTELRFATPVTIATCLFVVIGEALQDDARAHARPRPPRTAATGARPRAAPRVAAPRPPPAPALPPPAAPSQLVCQNLRASAREVWHRSSQYGDALERLAVESTETALAALERSLRAARRGSSADLSSLEARLTGLREDAPATPPRGTSDPGVEALRQEVARLWQQGEREPARLIAQCLQHLDRLEQQIDAAERALASEPGILLWRDALRALEGAPDPAVEGFGGAVSGSGPVEARPFLALYKLLRLEPDLPHALRAQLGALLRPQSPAARNGEARRRALALTRAEYERRWQARQRSIRRALTPDPERTPPNRLDMLAHRRFGNSAEWRRLWKSELSD